MLSVPSETRYGEHRHASTASVVIREEWNKAPEAHVIIERFLKMTRLLGCGFIEGLFTDNASTLRPQRASWYLVYTLTCIGFIFACAVHGVRTNISRGTMDGDIYLAVCVFYLLQALATFLTMFMYAPQLVEIVTMCIEFEVRRPLALDQRRRLNHFFMAVVLWLTLDFVVKNFLRMALVALSPSVSEFFLNATIVSGVLLMLSWSTIPQVGVVVMSRWLTVFLCETQNMLVRCVNANRQRSCFALTEELMRSTKRDLSLLRRILGATNDVFQGSVLVAYSSCVVGLCCASFSIIRGGRSFAELVQNFLFFAVLAGGYVGTTWSADNVPQQVAKLRLIMRSYSENGLVPPPARRQFQSFLLSLDSEDFCLSAAGFFHIKLGILSTIAGAVFTYTLILIQTSLHFGTGCLEQRHRHHEFLVKSRKLTPEPDY